MAHALGILLALLPTYLIRFKIFGFPTTLLEILIVVFLLLIVLRLMIEDFSKLKSLGKINWAIGLFVLAGIISTIVSPETERALGQLKAFIIEPILLFYASILVLKNESHIKIALKWLFISSGIVSLFGIVQYFTFLSLPPRFWGSGEEMTRVISFFEHPNQLALYLAPLIVFFTVLFIHQYQVLKSRAWSVLIILSMLTALMMTFSRGAWLAVAIGLFIIFVKRYSLKKLILPAILGLLLILFITPVRERLGSGISDASSSAHADLMKVGLNKVIESPLLGNGLYGFRTTLQEANFQGEIINYPHNIFLNFWVEMGFLGLLAFVLIFFFSVQQYKNQPTILKFAAGMFLVTIFVHGLVDIPYLKNDLAVMFWFILSLFYTSYSR